MPREWASFRPHSLPIITVRKGPWAIRAGDTDGNPRTDPDLTTPLITTPCFPSYPSAHASASYAERTIAEKIFGSGRHAITLSHPGIPDVILHYTKFSQITDDIDDARVYGGIHFRFDQEAGVRQGRRVGSYVYKNNLRGSSDEEDCGEDEWRLVPLRAWRHCFRRSRS